MTEPSGRRIPGRPLALVLWTSLAAMVTVALWAYRDVLNQAHVALAYLLVVLFASAREGRVVGLFMAVLCFLLFNFFLLPPFYTFDIADPLEWWVLLSFLITGAVAAELLYRAQRARALAEERAREIARLAEEARHVEALREADRLKDAMLANVSHDLRTPLTSIRAAAAEMRAQGHEDAAIIEEEAERLNRFVTDLLDLSRIRAGALPMEPALNAADDLIGAALDRVRALPGATEIRVGLPPDAPILVGRFDFVQALRALVNLLENGLRHSPTGEPVELEAVRAGATLLFHVRDRGPGIPVEDRERLFEPFQRGRTATGRLGLGLGLAIARGTARAGWGRRMATTGRGRERLHAATAGGGRARPFLTIPSRFPMGPLCLVGGASMSFTLMQTPRRQPREGRDPVLDSLEKGAPWLVFAILVALVILWALSALAGAR